MVKVSNIALLFLLSISCFAQYATLNFGNFTSRDGLSNDYVDDILVDHHGYVWVATWDGLNRFDGKNWKVYKHSDTDSCSILSNEVVCLHEDVNKRLWIGTRHGFSYYDEKKDVFITPKKCSNWKNNELVHRIYTDPTNSDVLFCTMRGLYRYSYLQNKYAAFFESSNSFGNIQVLSLYFDSSNMLYIGTFGNGFFTYNIKTKELRKISGESNSFFDYPLTDINDFVKISENKLLLATTMGLATFNIQTNTLESLTDKNVLIRSLFTDDKENIWVSKVNAPIEILNRKLETKMLLKSFYCAGQSKKYNTTSVVREDAMGNLWIGSHGNGLFYVDKFQNSIVSYSATTPLLQPLQSNIVSCFLERADGKIWLGTDGGGLHLFDPRASTFEVFDLFQSKAILDIQPASGGKLWVATYGGGLNLFDPQTRRVTTFMIDKNLKSNFPCNEIKTLYPIGDSLLYIGFMGFGFAEFDVRTHRIKHFQNDTLLAKAFRENRWCMGIMKDKRGRVWISTSAGLCLKSAKTFTTFQNIDTVKTSLSDNFVNFTFEDSQGRIFVGTNNGLDLWKESNRSFIRLRNKLPLPDNFKSMLEDVYGNFWISTNLGVYKIDKQLQKVSHYDEHDGLQGNHFFAHSSMKDSKGNLYFGGLNGFSIINPKTAIQTNMQTPIVFTDFQVFNKSQLPNAEGSILVRDINFIDTVSLRYNQSVFSFEFGNLDVLGATKVQYRYKLDNFDHDWYEADGSNKVTYTNLDPGLYTLEIQSSNRFGKWDKPSEKRIYIDVLTPWWMSWWFRLSVILVVGSYIAYEVRKYYRRNIILAQMVLDRTSELQRSNEDLKQQYQITQAQRSELIEKNTEIETQKEEIESQNDFLLHANEKLENTVRTKDKFMSIIGHDLKNPISAVIGISELAVSNFDKLSDAKKLLFFKTMHSSAVSIFDLLESLLLWARTQTGGVEYKPERFLMSDVVLVVVDLLNDSAMKKDILLKTEVSEHCEVFADKNMINTIIRNLVSNAIKFTPRDGVITISVTQQPENRTRISISDTGMGMTEEQIGKLFMIGKTNSTNGTENETGTGLGLILCSEFLKLHNSKFDVTSVVEEGTEFSFELLSK